MGTPKHAAAPVAEPESSEVAELHRVIASLSPLHADKKEPGPNDWLASHSEEGQSFDQYREEDPVVPDLERGPGKRHTLYIQPLGKLTPTQTKIVELTARYMHRFFGIPVKLSANLPMSLVPESARRTHPTWGTKQVLTSHILNDVLQPRLPADAAAYISFTASDLWPGKGWNFVFGQASLTERVGVWSVHRYGNPDQSEEAYRRVLLRTLKVAVHETGHMFSIKHCTAHECVMGGSNNLDETDRAPVWLCPQCMAKLCWATRTDPIARYRKLADFMHAQGFEKQAAFFEKSIETLKSARSLASP
jgi:archaemetzincin